MQGAPLLPCLPIYKGGWVSSPGGVGKTITSITTLQIQWLRSNITYNLSITRLYLLGVIFWPKKVLSFQRDYSFAPGEVAEDYRGRATPEAAEIGHFLADDRHRLARLPFSRPLPLSTAANIIFRGCRIDPNNGAVGASKCISAGRLMIGNRPRI